MMHVKSAAECFMIIQGWTARRKNIDASGMCYPRWKFGYWCIVPLEFIIAGK